MTRYIVDLRVGLVAVVDTEHPEYEPRGDVEFHPATIKVWLGKPYKHPDSCDVWYVPDACKRAAERLCQRLNDGKDKEVTRG